MTGNLRHCHRLDLPDIFLFHGSEHLNQLSHTYMSSGVMLTARVRRGFCLDHVPFLHGYGGYDFGFYDLMGVSISRTDADSASAADT